MPTTIEATQFLQANGVAFFPRLTPAARRPRVWRWS